MSTDNKSTRVSKNADFLNKIKNSTFLLKLKEIKNLPLIIAIIILALCLLAFTSQKQNGEQSANSSNQLETRLSETLSAIDGAGEVQCMIYRGEQEEQSGIFKSKNEGGEIVGVIIVSEGAKDISVMLKLKEAAVTALSVEPNKVQVYKKQQK